jgi:RNA polymerase sigma-70 factor (subfamily 1)
MKGSFPLVLGSAFQELLRKARAGCGQALGVLFQSYQEPLLETAKAALLPRLRRRCGPSDLVQEAFLKAKRSFEQFAGESEEEWRAWLCRILRNSLRDFFKKHAEAAKRDVGQLRSPCRFEEQMIASAALPETDALRREEEQALRDALDALPEASRRVVILHYQNHSFREIARELGCSKDTARRAFIEAFMQLQDRLLQRQSEGADGSERSAPDRQG